MSGYPSSRSFDDAPLRLERAVHGERGQEHHRILPEASHHDQVKLLLRVRRQPHRHRAERYRHRAFLSVRIERDAVRMAHRALPREIPDFLERAPRKDAAPLEAYYEVVPFADEEG